LGQEKSGVRIRRGHLRDGEPLARLKYELDLHHRKMSIWPPECDMNEARKTVKEMLKDRRNAVFVAECLTKEIIGIVNARLVKRETVHSEYGKVGEIGIIYVKDAYRRRGIGKRLVAACIDHFQRLGVRHVTLRSVVDNRASDRFWETLSFTPALYVRSSTVQKVQRRLGAAARG